MTKNLTDQKWIVSYDHVEAIRNIYPGVRNVIYDIGYSARSASMGSEIMFFCEGLRVPALGVTPSKTGQSTFSF